MSELEEAEGARGVHLPRRGIADGPLETELQAGPLEVAATSKGTASAVPFFWPLLCRLSGDIPAKAQEQSKGRQMRTASERGAAGRSLAETAGYEVGHRSTAE